MAQASLRRLGRLLDPSLFSGDIELDDLSYCSVFVRKILVEGKPSC